MKRLHGGAAGTGRIEAFSRRIEARIGHWPAWAKLAAAAPILILASLLFMLVVSGINDLALALLHHR
ncbi:MAG: hypothetical protein JO303_02905 [Caulobacteraceae bacterium]|nr:hypothetical protein [Caulobacteraceae bacterium]